MEKITVDEIVKATNGVLVGRGLRKSISSISIDSRSLQKDDFFIPIKGDNFDGHNFINDVCNKNICGFLFSYADTFDADLIGKKSLIGIKVEDTTKALQDIAAYYRNKYKITMAAVTGSNGKTTTKDILGSVLSSRQKVLVTQGNKNNHIGVPLMLLQLEKNIKKAVLELGMNHKGEITRLTQLVKPDVAIVTNIGYAHMEFFNSLQEVAEAKLEITTHLKEDGVLIVNGDDNVLMDGLKDYSGKIITFGLSDKNDVWASDIVAASKAISFNLNVESKIFPVSINLIGKHNVYNVLAAFCGAKAMGMMPSEILDAFSDIRISDNRMRKQVFKGVTFINDAYNANPSSTNAAISAFSDLGVAGKKIFVFGDMKELGDLSDSAHLEVGKSVALSGIDFLITFGIEAKKAIKGAKQEGMSEGNMFSVETHKEAAEILRNIIKKDDAVLFKGSRAMKLEKIEKNIFDLMTEKKTQNEGALI